MIVLKNSKKCIKNRLKSKLVLVIYHWRDYNNGDCMRVCGCKPMPDAGKAAHVNRATPGEHGAF